MIETEFTCAAFYRFLREGKLMGVSCKDCRALYSSPRQICLKCQSTNVEWVPMKGEGKLITFTTIAVGTSQMAAEGYDRNRRYCCGIVELDEGPRVSAQIIGVDPQDPGGIEIGTPVRVEFINRQDRPLILTFKVL